jgi:hypothetical protein
MGVLAELTVLKKLNRHVQWINLRLDIRSQRGERVERFGARVLTLGILDVAITDVLRRRVTEDVSRRGVAGGVCGREVRDEPARVGGSKRPDWAGRRPARATITPGLFRGSTS